MQISLRSILTVPNLLSAFRIVVVPFIGWLLFVDSVPARLWAGTLVVLAVFSDLFDGMLARLLGQVTDVGKIIDPLADKLFVILLTLELIILRDFPIWLAAVIVGKDLLIICGSLLVIGRRKVVIQSTVAGKYAFAFQAGLVFSYFLNFPFGKWFYTWGSLILIAATLASYGRALAEALRSPADKEFIYKPKQYVPTWLRRVLAHVVSIVSLAQVGLWAMENNVLPAGGVELRSLPLAEARELARRHAPILVRARENDALPAGVEAYIGACEVRRGGRFLWGIMDSTVAGNPRSGGSIPAAAGGDTYLRPRAPIPVEHPPTVYARVCRAEEGESTWTVVQYWLFFPFEQGIVPRNGDWQMLAVYLDGQGEPRYIALTQSWVARAFSWEGGEVERSGSHPRVYVAPGSHSLYERAGEFATYFDEEGLIPLGSERAFSGRELNPGGDYTIEMIEGGEPWVSWPGLWGGPQPGGDRGPRYWNPKRAERAPWSHPMEFLRFFLRPR